MKETMPFIRRSGVCCGIALVVTLVLAGCVRAPSAPRSAAPVRDDGVSRDELHEWYDVLHVDISTGKRVVERVGMLHKVIRPGKEIYYVHDLKDRTVGFMLPDLQAYRYTRSFDIISGKTDPDAEYVGSLGAIDRGVQRILGLDSGTIELRSVESSPRAAGS